MIRDMLGKKKNGLANEITRLMEEFWAEQNETKQCQREEAVEKKQKHSSKLPKHERF